MSERCVCCGAEVPEGRQVCPACERAQDCVHVWVFEGFVRVNGKRRHRIVWKCSACGATRIEAKDARPKRWIEW